ncbi:MAG: PSD1 and planctomycete cytochrome C domain-containing protein, partial [Pirellulales bacterium]
NRVTIVVPGEPEKSLLIKAVRYADPLLQMPPSGRLAPREVDVLVEWVRMGAPDPRSEAAQPAAPKEQYTVSAEARQWWSFQPMREPAVPVVRNERWPAGEIDRFVLAGLEADGMTPAPPADKRTLIRRATFALTGLPPTLDEIDAFVADDATDAFAKVVDRLLASPHYGERWGRRWLDLVRYADTSGCNSDFPVPEAYRYRNYVIDSFNRDKPYDRFLREQLAGDLLAAEGQNSPSEDSNVRRYEQIVATGYLAISRRFSSLAEEFHLTLDDTVDNFGKAILGLTISCARCHAHKFDPIPQEDYYALYGIFQSTTYSFPGTEIYRHTQDLVPLVPAERRHKELLPYLERMAELDARIFATYSHMATLDTGNPKNELRARWQAMQKERDELVKSLPDFPKAYAASEGTPTNARLHLKGNPESLGPEIPRGFLQILGGQKLAAGQPASGRRELAGWITDPQNPLTARVMVNRVWQHHFGRGLVRTPDDFGTRGAPPTHPELLDYLALRFIEDGWSLKALHRRILLSRVWQTACIENADYARRDPDNERLWTFNRRRLEAEEFRDAMLAISGALDRSPGGAHPFKPEWDWRYSQHQPFVDDFATNRRTVYLMQQRIRQQPFLAVFDGADTNAATGVRQVSTTPQQALFLLNSEFAHELAGLLADGVAREAQQPRARLDRAFRLALGRPATGVETDEGLEYIDRIGPLLGSAGIADGDRSRAAWASYLRVLLSGNEFMFIE